MSASNKAWGYLRAALSVVALLGAAGADARCGPRPEQLSKDYLLGSTVVVLGTVVAVHNDPKARHEGYAVLQLKRSWKGAPASPLRVYRSDSVHGYQFDNGKSYLVFANEYEDRLEAGICSETCEESECRQKLLLLGPPAKVYE